MTRLGEAVFVLACLAIGTLCVLIGLWLLMWWTDRRALQRQLHRAIAHLVHQDYVPEEDTE